jgi:GNAT superfamily N-acetyltransferase
MIKIESKLIQSDLTHKIRFSVLWPHKNIYNCSLIEDNLKDTFHVGTFMKNELVSIGTFIYQNNIIFDKNDKQYRLRAMATEKKHQGKSMGKKLILFAKNELIKRKVKLLWCDARKIAIPFYENLGFKSQGKFYHIPKIGPHKLMYLYL